MTADSTTDPPDVRRKPPSLAVKIAIAAAVVLAILGVGLAATLVLGNVSYNPSDASTQVRQIHSSVQLYQMTKCKLPDVLRVLAERDESGQTFLAEVPQDPWGNDFVLVAETPRQWKVLSFGADGLDGTEDDISSAEGER